MPIPVLGVAIRVGSIEQPHVVSRHDHLRVRIFQIEREALQRWLCGFREPCRRRQRSVLEHRMVDVNPRIDHADPDAASGVCFSADVRAIPSLGHRHQRQRRIERLVILHERKNLGHFRKTCDSCYILIPQRNGHSVEDGLHLCPHAASRHGFDPTLHRGLPVAQMFPVGGGRRTFEISLRGRRGLVFF